MSIVLKIRMLSDEDENFIRDYEVIYNTTLLDFYNFMCEDLEYDPLNISSIFTSNDIWEKLREFTPMDMGVEDENAPLPMDSVIMGQLLADNKDRMIFVFDTIADRSLFLELTGAEKDEGKFDYPRVLFANGVAPDQFDADMSITNKSIFEEAMDDYSDFDGDEAYEDEF